MTLRVLIADDQPLMRRALADCLRVEPDIEVVAEAGNGQQAVDLATRLRPDVAILDIRMPVLDGVEATRRIVHATPPLPTRVVVVTTFDLDEYIVTALRAGASGFPLKDATPEELVRARAFVSACRWQFAVTVPEHPHEYSLRRWLSSEGQQEFDWLAPTGLTDTVGALPATSMLRPGHDQEVPA